MKRLVLLFICIHFIAGVHAQTTTTPQPYFTVEGEVVRPLKWTKDDLLKLKPAEAKVKDREGKEHTYKGVRLADVLDSAGVTLGGNLRGENLTKYLLVQAADGYEVIFSLPEIDPEFTNQIIVLAYEVDGASLRKVEGPFRLVVPHDKKQARWVREIRSIKVLFSK